MKTISYLMKPIFDYWLLSDRFADVPGFLDPIEGYVLMLTAAYGPGEGGVVEIGSFVGRSTCYLAQGLKTSGRGKMLAVDHFRGSPEHHRKDLLDPTMRELMAKPSLISDFVRNVAIKGLADWVTPMASSSEEAAKDFDRPIRLLFIDGDHSYQGSKLDFELWSPHVVLMKARGLSSPTGARAEPRKTIPSFSFELIHLGRWQVRQPRGHWLETLQAALLRAIGGQSVSSRSAKRNLNQRFRHEDRLRRLP